jgi:hypothetical protein
MASYARASREQDLRKQAQQEAAEQMEKLFGKQRRL